MALQTFQKMQKSGARVTYTVKAWQDATCEIHCVKQTENMQT